MGKGSRTKKRAEIEVMQNVVPLNDHDDEIESHHIAVRQMVRSGPIPPPEDLRIYEEICPGAADRIIAMAEKEQQNRHTNEQSLVTSVSKGNLRGITWAGTISMVIVIGGIMCIMSNHGVAGAFLGVSGLAGIIGTFLKNTSLISPEESKNDK